MSDVSGQNQGWSSGISADRQARAQMDPEWCSSSSPLALDEKTAPFSGDTFFPHSSVFNKNDFLCH